MKVLPETRTSSVTSGSHMVHGFGSETVNFLTGFFHCEIGTILRNLLITRYVVWGIFM